MSDNAPTPPPVPGGYNAPPPYGSAPVPGYAPYGGAPLEHPQGTTILVLGILGLVCCGPLGIAAWVMGNSAIKEIDASGQVYGNRGQINAGRICGIVASVLMALGVLAWLVLIAVAPRN